MDQISVHQKENYIRMLTDDLPHNDQVTDKNNDERTYISYRESIDPYVTSFVCLLAPRFEEHLLDGDLSTFLDKWMRDICISCGWNLKFIEIEPEYMHWIMTVSITSFPTQFMKIVRHETSKKIFEDFPRFKEKNISNDFWAPWYFVGMGEVPYSESAIQSYIDQIRIEQGLK